VVVLVLILSACGPRVGNTFSTISNSLPDDVPAEEPIEAPAATEESHEDYSPTVVLSSGGALSTPTFEVVVESLSLQSTPVTIQPSIPEQRRLTLEFPPQIRAGDSDRVRLTLEVDELGNLTPTAAVAGNVVTGEVIEIPNVYETHHVIAEAQFDIAGLQVTPANRVSQPLAPGQSVTFYWSIFPEGVGVYRGTIWLYLKFVDAVTGEESERAVSAQPVEIEAVNYLGLSVNLARSFGVFGSLLGTVLGFPFLEDIVRFFLGRRRTK
jgi:hypothetical protein